MTTQSVKITGLEQVINTLQQLPAELVSKRGGPVRKALRRGALVIKNQAAKNVNRSTGLLAQSLTVRIGRMQAKGERYIVTVKREKSSKLKYKSNARNLSIGRAGAQRLVSPAYYAKFLEFGTAKMTARPFMRPAFEQKKTQAIETTSSYLVQAVDQLAREYLRG